MREIHGKSECPFAWRARIVAREKGLPFDWIPFDVERPDPRAAQHNAEQKSPRLVEDGFELTESLVIVEYLDEAFAEPHLSALGARERAQMRLRMKQLAKLEVHAQPELDEKSRSKVRAGWAELDRMLADGRQWLGGSGPDLSDVAVWPFLALLEKYGHPIPPDFKHAAAYWSRAKDRDSLSSTRPR